jgi:hypothetical protein
MIHQPEEFAAVGDKMELICIAGLCHDLGHGPMSHWFDDLCESLYHPDDRPAWTRHEKRSVSVFRAIVEQQHLDMSDEDVEFICGQIDKKSDEEIGPWYARLINNPVSGIDTDKLDYLLRDGTAYGLRSTFDPMRIIRNCRVIDNELCFCDRVVDEGCYACLPIARGEVCGNGVDDDCDGLAEELCGCVARPEVCGNGADDDCDGLVDDGCFGIDVSPEICNGRDDDGDGLVDEGFDRDGDGFTACGGDCDDRRADRNPNSVEVCDGVDNDCDGLVDNADACF